MTVTFLIVFAVTLSAGFVLGVVFSHIVLGTLHQAVADVKAESQKIQEAAKAISLLK
jgi:hypothetical protein